MSDEQKQKLIEYSKKHSEAKNERKRYMYHNMTDEKRQKVNDYQKEYRKKHDRRTKTKSKRLSKRI